MTCYDVTSRGCCASHVMGGGAMCHVIVDTEHRHRRSRGNNSCASLDHKSAELRPEASIVLDPLTRVRQYTVVPSSASDILTYQAH